jgi:hypothetical protein
MNITDLLKDNFIDPAEVWSQLDSQQQDSIIWLLSHLAYKFLLTQISTFPQEATRELLSNKHEN